MVHYYNCHPCGVEANGKNTAWSILKVSNNQIEKHSAIPCVIGLPGPPSPRRRLDSCVTASDFKDSPSAHGANMASIVEQKGLGGKWIITFVDRRELRGYSATLTLTVYGCPIGRLDIMSGNS